MSTNYSEDDNDAYKKRIASGKKIREKFPRKSHAVLVDTKRDPLKIHIENDEGRIKDLLPIRYERMLESPFALFRGSVAVMAYDLSKLRNTGLRIQICGDCHLLNFGGFATPERNIIFDINDFDETAVAPWEWDVKRLGASFYVAGQEKRFSNAKNSELAYRTIRSYQKHLRKFSKVPALQLWYSTINFKELNESGSEQQLQVFNEKKLEKQLEATPHEREFEKLVENVNGKFRIADNPPLIYHVPRTSRKAFDERALDAYKRYYHSLDDNLKALLSNYKIHDTALKVVGVGSVGTWCGIYLLMTDSGNPLFLQFKEAFESVYASFGGESKHDNHGRRVVEGQKLMQSASDIFLGWTSDEIGRNYYIRQMRDAKIKPDIDSMDFKNLKAYAKSCGRALAQAHARSGAAVEICGYIGKNNTFAKAASRFAKLYSARNEDDFKIMVSAAAEGTIYKDAGK